MFWLAPSISNLLIKRMLQAFVKKSRTTYTTSCITKLLSVLPKCSQTKAVFMKTLYTVKCQRKLKVLSATKKCIECFLKDKN